MDSTQLFKNDEKQRLLAKVNELTQQERFAYNMERGPVLGAPEDIYSRENISEELEFINELLADSETMEELKLSENQKARLLNMRAREASHLLINDSSLSKSKKFASVKSAVSGLEDFLNLNAKESLELVMDDLPDLYDKAIKACVEFLEKNPDDNEAVYKVYTSLAYENDNLKTLKDKMDDGAYEGMSLGEAMGFSLSTDESLHLYGWEKDGKSQNVGHRNGEDEDLLIRQDQEINIEAGQVRAQKEQKQDEELTPEERIQEAYEDTLSQLEMDPVIMSSVRKDVEEENIQIEDAAFHEQYIAPRQFVTAGLFSLGIQREHLTQNARLNDCYLLSTLIGLVEKYPDFIKNRVIEEEPAPANRSLDRYVNIHVYDANGCPVKLRLKKTHCDKEDPRSKYMWVQMIEKAAMVMLRKDADGGVRLRTKEEIKAQGEEAGSFQRDDISYAGTEIAMRMLFGKKGKFISNRDTKDDSYNENGIAKSKRQSTGDVNIGKILAYLEKGKMVNASTCANEGGEFYNRNEEAVLFPTDELLGNHTFSVLKEGNMKNGERTLLMRDPFGKDIEVPFSIFNQCFQDIYVYGVENEKM